MNDVKETDGRESDEDSEYSRVTVETRVSV